MRKRLIKVVAVVLIMVMASSMAVSARQMPVCVNGHYLTREVCQVAGFDMLPILDVAGELGFEANVISYSKACVRNGSDEYYFELGNANVSNNTGRYIGLDIVPQYMNGRFMIPAKFFQDVFGHTYSWDLVSDTVFLNAEIAYSNALNDPWRSFSDLFIEKMKSDLGIPSNVSVSWYRGTTYYWEGAGIYVTPVSFYQGDDLVACADFDLRDGSPARGILNYTKPTYSQPTQSYSYSSSLISNRSVSEINNYVNSYVKPLYSEVNNNIWKYTRHDDDFSVCWYDGKGVIKKTYYALSDDDAQRDYYYDTNSGRIAFAYINSGTEQYRLYFRTNQLVRYIGPDGVTVNNPTDSFALEIAELVMSECYQ